MFDDFIPASRVASGIEATVCVGIHGASAGCLLNVFQHLLLDQYQGDLSNVLQTSLSFQETCIKDVDSLDDDKLIASQHDLGQLSLVAHMVL